MADEHAPKQHRKISVVDDSKLDADEPQTENKIDDKAEKSQKSEDHPFEVVDNSGNDPVKDVRPDNEEDIATNELDTSSETDVEAKDEVVEDRQHENSDAHEQTETSRTDAETTDGKHEHTLGDKTAESEKTENEMPVTSSQPSHVSVFGRFKRWCGRHKKTVIALSVVIVIAVLASVPWTRYKIAGLFLKQTATIVVLDQQTQKPISSATVTLGSTTAHTDNKGQAHIRIRVGSAKLQVTKAYYRSAISTVLVPIMKPKNANQVHLQATGRQVPVSVVNTITGKAVDNITVKTADTEVKTDQKGQATLVLPANKQTVSATISGAGYNSKTVTVTITETAIAANTFQVTPAGKIYFLSNRSGTIDVVKSDLDGANRQTVLAGTGKEDQANTVLLASRDWKYLALYSKRDGGDNAKIFLINTSNDALTTMDEGNASFALIGWNGHHFVYDVVRNTVQQWQPNREALKSFNADTQTITALDQNDASGDSTQSVAQTFADFNLIGDQLVYVTQWTGYYLTAQTKTMTVRTVGVDGTAKKDLKSFDQASYSTYPRVIPGATSVYYDFYKFASPTNADEYYEYEDGAVKTADISADQFNDQSYPTYLQSPSGKLTLWSDVRDGKNSLFVGDDEGQKAQEILSQSDQNAYGWYTDDYVLSAKSGSELYVMSAKGGQQIKITDYYKPQNTYRGYGGGYGGL